MEPIRLQVVVEAGKQGSVTGIEQLVAPMSRAIDSSMQYAVQKATTQFDGMMHRVLGGMQQIGTGITSSFSGVTAELSKIDQVLNSILAKMTQIRGTGGAGGGAGGPGGGGGVPGTGSAANMAGAAVTQLISDYGMRPTGAQSVRVDRQGNVVTSTQYRGGGAVAMFRDDDGGGTVRVRALQDIARLNAESQKYFMESGFREVSRQIVRTLAGEGVVSRYRDAAGRTGTRNTLTGDWRADEMAEPNRGPKGSGLWNAAAWLSVVDRLTTMSSKLLSAGASVVTGFTQLSKKIVDVNDDFRKFEISLSGVTGGIGRSMMLDDEIIRLSRRSPLTIGELQNVTETAAFIPAMTSRIAQRDPAAAAAEIDQFSRIAGKLKFLAPEQGDMGVAIALREAYAGQYQSLSRRFNVRKEDLAAAIGLNFEQLNAEPSKILPALEAYLQSIVPDSAFDRLADRIQVQSNKIVDSVKGATRKIANAGFYDNLLERLRTFREGLDQYIDSPQFDRLAARLGGMFDRIAGNIARGGVALLRGASGADYDAASFEEFGDQIGMLTGRFAELTDAVVPAAGAIGKMAMAALEFAVWVANRLPGAKSEADRRQEAMNIAAALTGAGIRWSQNLPTQYNAGAGGPMDGNVSRPWWDFTPVRRTAEFDLPPGVSPEAMRKLIADIQRYGGQLPPDANPQTYGFPSWFQFRGVNNGPDVSGIRRQLREIGDPNYAAQARSINSVFSRFTADDAGLTGFDRFVREMEDLFKQGSGIGKVVRDIQDDAATQRNALRSIADDLSSRLSTGYGFDTDRDLKYLITDSVEGADKAARDKAKAEIERLITSAPKEAQSLIRLYTEAQQSFVQFGVMANTVVRQLKEAVPQAMEQYALGLAEQFQSSAQGSSVLDPIINGTSRFAEGIARELELQVRAFEQFSLRARVRILGQYMDARRREISEAGSTGGFLTINERMVLSGPDARRRYGQPESDRATLLRQLEFERSMMSQLDADRELARQKATEEGATQADIETFARADEAVKRQAENLRKLESELDYTKANFLAFGIEVRHALDSGIGEGIYNLISGVGTLGDAFRGLAQDIMRAFSQMAANSIITSLIGNLGQMQQNDGVGGLGGLIGSMFGYGDAGAAPVTAAADGAIFPGGFTPIGMYAAGGVVKGGRGMLGIIGEGGPGRDEAIVPMVGGRIPLRMGGSGLEATLPGGRSIPAGIVAFADGGIARGGIGPHYDLGVPAPMPAVQGGGGGNTYIVNNLQEAKRKGYDPKRDTLVSAQIESVVAASINRGGAVGKAIQRRRLQG